MPPVLYDVHGNPIDKTRLKQELAGPTVTGLRQILSGHPAQNLRPKRLAALLREAEGGDATAYLELAEEMEEKDLHYRAVLSTRKLQVSGLPVTVEAASDAAEDVKAADLVRDFLSTGSLQGALEDILDAVGKGYSACEILWDTEGRTWFPSDIVWRDPRWFEFDRLDGVTLLLKGEQGLPEPLAPGKFIVHTHKSKSGLPIRGGLARPVAWFYLFKNFDIKSWVQFAQVFGFPLRLGRYDSSATEEEKQTLLRAVRSISQDAAAIIPDGMQIEFQGTNATGNISLFEGLALYFDRQISKLVLGQTGTTDVGQHVGTANAHEKVRDDITKSDAAQLSATLNRDLIRPLVDLNCGPRKRYPILKVDASDPEDVTSLVDNVVKLAAVAPNLVEVSVMRDKLGLPEPTAGAEVLGRKEPDEDKPDEDTPDEPAGKAAQAAGALPKREGTEGGQPDHIDFAVAEELEGWEPLLSPLVGSLLAYAEGCASAEEFVAGLPSALQGQEAGPLSRNLSLAMMEQRGKGNG